ncbi:MAG: hypothetical protein FWD31_14510, partial [Planctomycetaceae bacterium]|nr:hypothetical protein [Planctomycetaceae bacterium]
PPLSESERQGLEADILKHGCLSPIVTWGGIIVDGHVRYAICTQYGLPFETHEIPFPSLDEAMYWAWQHQENRRNLTPYQRTEIALQFKPMLAAKAKNNMSMGGRGQLDELTPIVTRRELSQIAGVSEGTLGKAEYLIKHADDETKQHLRKGETTINREYIRLKEVDKPMLPQPVSIPVKKMTSFHITPGNTKKLIECIAGKFGVKEMELLMIGLFDRMQKVKSKSALNLFMKKLFNKYYR